jgi:hypothetical protein
VADSNEEKFFSFDEALDKLRLKEEELKRLVSEGEIRAFRDGETMKLRVGDVESLKDELSGGELAGEVVDLGDVGEELVLEDDVFAEAGMATEELSEMDTLLDDDVQDVGEIQVDDLEELEVIEEVGEGTVELEALDLDELEPDEEAAAGAVAGGVVKTSVLDQQEDEPYEGTGMRALLIASSVVLVLAMPVALAFSADSLSRLARGIGGMFATFPE